MEKVIFQRSKQALDRYIGFLNSCQNYKLRLAERLTLLFQHLKQTVAEANVSTNPDRMKDFREFCEAFNRCCQLTLRQPIPDKPLVLMKDARFQENGYAVLIEDEPHQITVQSTRKNYAPRAYGSKTYTSSQNMMFIYTKEFIAIYLASKKVEHIFWGITKPVIIMTDSNSVNPFFQTKDSPILVECVRLLLQYI